VLALIVVVLDQAGVKNPWILWIAFCLAVGLCLDAVIRSSWVTSKKFWCGIAMIGAYGLFAAYLIHDLYHIHPESKAPNGQPTQAAPTVNIEQRGDASGAVGGSIVQGPCSVAQVGGSQNQSSVNCVQAVPTIQSLMLAARWICTARADVERPLLSDRSFSMNGPTRAALIRRAQPELWLDLQSPIHQEEANGKLHITARYLVLQESGWIGKPVDSLPAEIDTVTAGVLFVALYDCAEDTSSADSMTIYVNGTDIWSSQSVSSGKDRGGAPIVTSPVGSWPSRDQLSKKLSPRSPS